MAFVLTVDQMGSRRDTDRVGAALERLNALRPLPTLPFERTAGDEFQGVLADAGQTVEVALSLVRDGHWSIGIGLGAIETPLPTSTRAGRGEAFVRARDSVERAKRSSGNLAVTAAEPIRAEDAEAVLTLLAVVLARRSAAGWEAVDLARAGATLSEAADTLGVSRQAVSQRLAAASWDAEESARPVAARLLERAEEEA